MKSISSLILFLCIITHPIFGNQNINHSIKINKINIYKNQKGNKVVSLEFKTLYEGKCNIKTQIQNGIENMSSLNDSIMVSKNQNIKIEKELIIHQDGYYFIDMIFKINPIIKSLNLKEYYNIPIYFYIFKGEIYGIDTKPDSNFTNMSNILKGNSKPKIIKKPNNVVLKDNDIQTNTISVNIDGKIQFYNQYGNLVGLPRVKVFLDWDFDNSTNIYYSPYTFDSNDPNDNHVGY